MVRIRYRPYFAIDAVFAQDRQKPCGVVVQIGENVPRSAREGRERKFEIEHAGS